MLLDLIVILIIALFTFIGYKQGLVKIAIKVLAFFIALFIAVSLYKVVGNLIINNTNFDEKIENKILSKVLPENYEEKVSLLPDSLVESGGQTINNLAMTVSHKIVYYLTFLLLFILAKIFLQFVTILADLITKLPIIKQFDKLGGLIYGFIKGFLIVMVLFAFVSLLSPILDEKYIETIDNSYLSKTLYDHNIIIGLIK